MSDHGTVGELLTFPEASRYSGASVSTLRTWMAKGYVHAYEMPGNGRPRLKKSELDRLLGDLNPSPGKSPR